MLCYETTVVFKTWSLKNLVLTETRLRVSSFSKLYGMVRLGEARLGYFLDTENTTLWNNLDHNNETDNKKEMKVG
jgi:hypothetical protein